MYDFLNKLHKELNKNDQILGQTLKFEDMINKEGNIDWTNEKSVISASVTLFSNKFKSKITDQFYYLSKICHECPECKRIIKYSCNICCICSMYPDRAAKYLNKTELNINDLFQHYRKQRLYLDENINCQYCKKVQKDINKTKILYTSPYNLILEIDYYKENSFHLTIDQTINIQQFVERIDICKVNYYLVGAIFIELNENKSRQYVSISRNLNGNWYYFKGNSIQICSFNDLQNHKNLRMLFYSSQ